VAMNNDALLGRAILCATLAHDGQYREDGLPYITHPMRVMDRLWPSQVLMAAGILHDVVEDTSINLENIKELFPSKVVSLVDALTRRDGEPYKEYLHRLINEGCAAEIKLFDIYDNYNRLYLIRDPARRARLTTKYEKALVYLKANGGNPD
jgi:(p)ppGpp synthase/HD superfamily hydrolase